MNTKISKLEDEIRILSDKIEGLKQEENTFEDLIYLNKFTLFLESEVPDQLDDGLYYVCGDSPILKPYVKNWINDILSKKLPIPAGLRNATIDMFEFFEKYAPEARLSLPQFHSHFNKLAISPVRMDYYFSKHINPVKLIIGSSANSPKISLWGTSFLYSEKKEERDRILELTILLNLAYHISHRNNLNIILYKLQTEEFILQQKPVIKYSNDKKQLSMNTPFINYYNEKYPFTLVEWEKLYSSLSKIFLCEEIEKGGEK